MGNTYYEKRHKFHFFLCQNKLVFLVHFLMNFLKCCCIFTLSPLRSFSSASGCFMDCSFCWRYRLLALLLAVWLSHSYSTQSCYWNTISHKYTFPGSRYFCSREGAYLGHVVGLQWILVQQKWMTEWVDEQLSEQQTSPHTVTSVPPKKVEKIKRVSWFQHWCRVPAELLEIEHAFTLTHS